MTICRVQTSAISLTAQDIKSRQLGIKPCLQIRSLQVASWLTEPICKAREYFYLQFVPGQHKGLRASIEKVRLIFQMIVAALLTPFTTPIGILLRWIVARLSGPYVYIQGSEGKSLPLSRKVSIAVSNVAWMPGGYSITDAGVSPPSDTNRKDQCIQKAKSLNPDIICLYEVLDIRDAMYATEQLQDYPYVIPVVGIRGMGPSSMMYVASKYEIVEESIRFIPFIKDVELTGRAKFSEKGVLVFDLKEPGSKVPFASVISTHLQHSEDSSKPTELDVSSRKKQMELVMKITQEKSAKNVMIVGDLNQQEDELQSILTRDLKRDPRIFGQATWGGNGWCKKLMKEPVSGPLVLDYAFAGGKAQQIETTLVDMGFDGSHFGGISDHKLLYSEVTMGKVPPLSQ